MSNRLLSGLVAFAAASAAYGAQIPAAGDKDVRIRFALYDPYDVVTIYTRVGLETHVALEADERIVDMTGGDTKAWGVATKHARNGIFLKPAGELADTNLHVITSKRTYSFDLRLAKKAKGEVGFMTVYFRYPAAERAADVVAKEAAAIRALLDAPSPAVNRSYSVKGSGLLAPMEAWDDGRSTFLRFRARSSIPAIYTVHGEDDTNEQIETVSIKDDVVQVHAVRRKLVLRVGREVACVFNDAFSLDAKRPATNTVSPLVNRSLKGIEK